MKAGSFADLVRIAAKLMRRGVDQMQAVTFDREPIEELV